MITILGPTASGKTSLACEIAYRTGGEIISADSRQVYKGMDIGTGKDLDEFVVNGVEIPHHLIDIHEAGYEYNVFQYQTDFLNAYNEVVGRDKLPILCGGSGLYLEAVLKGYRMMEVPPDPAFRMEMEQREHQDLIDELKSFGPLHNSTDTSSKKRTIRALEIAHYCQEHDVQPEPFPQIQSTIIGIAFERETLKQRITARLQARFEEGMVEEVQELLNKGLTPEQLKFYGLEYKFLTQYIEDELSYDEMFAKLNIAIHQFSKRQMTWFRKMEKDGFLIHWISGELEMSEKIEKLSNLIQF